MRKVYFERLPKPYDTDCQEYDTNNQFECINNCFKMKYHNRFGCIPSQDSLFTYKLDDHINFCNDTFLNNLTLMNSAIESSCYQNMSTILQRTFIRSGNYKNKNTTKY